MTHTRLIIIALAKDLASLDGCPSHMTNLIKKREGIEEQLRDLGVLDSEGCVITKDEKLSYELDSIFG